MKIGFILYLAGNNLKMRKLRSILTIGGMSIGIAAIVFLVSLGFGLQRIIVNRITNVQALTVLDVSTGTSTILKINDETLANLKKMPNVEGISPSISQSGQAVKGESVTDIALFGIQPQYLSLEGISPAFGKNFSDQDADSVIISTTAVELLGGKDPNDLLDETITLKIVKPISEKTETPQEKTSVKNAKKNANANTNADTEPNIQTVDVPVKIAGIVNNDNSLAYLPLGIFQKIGITNYNLARVKINSKDNLPAARAEIESRGFQVDSIADTVGQIDQIFMIFQFVMGGFGLIAMLVASLGAFNTLTVSLLERTREVGIMKSLGTTSKDVYVLFLLESLLIGFLGGASGILLGAGFGELINLIINRLAVKLGGTVADLFYIPLGFLGLIVAIIIVVGVITGLYPARRASKINALDALRYE